MRVVVKIGSSSLVTEDGNLRDTAVAKLAAEVARAMADGHQVVVVTSAAIATGLRPFGFDPHDRPRDEAVLRAASAVGQIHLMATYQAALAAEGLVSGQVLLAPTDFWFRNRYLKSRDTIIALLAHGAVPVINENDAVADDDIRFGDNDRLAALVAHLIDADRLVLLTDTAGLFTADPRADTDASLIEEIIEFDQHLEEMAGGPGSSAGRGGMASKLAAAKIATWSGVAAVIAQADRPQVVNDALAGVDGIGTTFRPRAARLSARKLWIAFAQRSTGRIVVDDGARRALTERSSSLLPAGIRKVEGTFPADDAVEVADQDGEVFAKGLVRWSSEQLGLHAGRRTSEVPDDLTDEVIHRDDLVMLPAS
ncbi:MAG: glutamate 5-kinase [Acidimicrobiales bacterium]